MAASRTLLVLTLLTLTTAAPLPQPHPQSDTHPGTGGELSWQLENQSDVLCASDRSSDYYGLGVRMGVYLTWLTGWVANAGVPKEIGGAMDQNAIFLFALLIAMVRCAITDLLSQMDGLILMHLMSGTVFSVLSVWGYRTCYYRMEGYKGIKYFGGFGTHMRLLLSLAVSILSLWFWKAGIMPGHLPTATDLDENNPRDCNDLHTFFFADLNARGGIRYYYIVITAICSVYFGIMTLVSATGPVTRVLKMKFLARYKLFKTSSRLKYATGFNYGQLKYLFHTLSILNIIWILYTMITVEMTLNYNHIDGVLGSNGRIFFPSQLLPFTIGLCSFVRVTYLRFELFRSPEDTDPSLALEEHAHDRTSTIPHGKHWLQAFSPSSPTHYHRNTQSHSQHAHNTEHESPLPTPSKAHHDTSTKETFENSDLDPEMEEAGKAWRYLCAWLPWLHATSNWFRKEKDEIKEHGVGSGVEWEVRHGGKRREI